MAPGLFRHDLRVSDVLFVGCVSLVSQAPLVAQGKRHPRTIHLGGAFFGLICLPQGCFWGLCLSGVSDAPPSHPPPMKSWRRANAAPSGSWNRSKGPSRQAGECLGASPNTSEELRTEAEKPLDRHTVFLIVAIDVMTTITTRLRVTAPTWKIFTGPSDLTSEPWPSKRLLAN